MIQTLLDDIKAYFDAKERLTEQEQLLRQRCQGDTSRSRPYIATTCKAQGSTWRRFPMTT